MSRSTAVIAVVSMLLGMAAPARADVSNFGIKTAEATLSTNQAGSHPDFTTKLSLNREPNNELPASTRDTFFELPPGLLANPTAVPTCTLAQLASTNVEEKDSATGCPIDSQVGITEVELFNSGGIQSFFEPVYNIEPGFGEPARLGFIAKVFPVLVNTRIRSEGDYGATAAAENIGSLIPLLSATTTIWGVPAAESHDNLRITPYESLNNGGVPETPSGKRSAGVFPKPFMVNPTRCGVEQGVNFVAIPYQLPSFHAEAFAPLGPNFGCGLLEFSPAMSVAPTTPQAETGTGLDVDLTFPTDGFEQPNLNAQADQKRVEVTLPKGMTVNPSEAAGGLGVCSEADFARETANSLPNEGCPETSKIGTVTASSPLLEEEATGSLFLAKPHQNPFGTLLSIYMVLRIPDRGVIVKLPGKVVPDPATGQLVATFGEPPYEIPQLPVSAFHLHFREGARAPLVTPPACGTYATIAKFTSWAGQQVTTEPTFEVSKGVNGGSCPSGGLRPFHPGLIAGTVNNAAGSYSPFYARLMREDDEQEITHFSIKLPPGVTGKLAGIPFCSDAMIAAAKARSGPLGGHEELERPSCPAASEVGHTLVGVGVGESLAYVPGKLYLAGPYNGAPLSIVSITSGVAGPFDLGTVVVREALKVNPETAEVFVDATGSDPIPHIIQGIPVHLRDIRIYVDRPDFVLNPTSCEPTSTASTVLGAGLDFTSEADDQPVTVSTRFQAADCASLGFKPKISLTLKGKTHRSALPSLKAVVTARPGDANIGRAAVTLPASEILEQGHLEKVCRKSIWIQGSVPGEKCPANSIYGYARAVTPLLDEPLEGPVYLRTGYGTLLPELVAALNSGKINIDVAGEIDAVHKKGSEISLLRTTFKTVPDAPVSKFVLKMQGGKQGLLVNTTDICAGSHRAKAVFTGQNGRVYKVKPAVKTTGCKGSGKKKH